MAVSILLVRGLVEGVEPAGVGRARFFEAAGFDGARIEDGDGRVSLDEYDTLVEHAIDLTGDAALGLHMGETASATTHSLVAHLVAHASNLREAIDALVRYHRLLGDRTPLRLDDVSDGTALTYDTSPGRPRAARFRTELAMAGFLRMVKFFGRGAPPERVTFAYGAPAYVAEYERIFEGLAVFGQARTQLFFAPGLLSLAALHHDPEFHAVLRTQADRRLARMERKRPYADRVREHLIDGPRPDQRDMEAVSRALGMSGRSLRRKLQIEGVTFVEIVNEARAFLAKRLLSEDSCSVEETAYELGFSDPSGFHRAFKRWTGTTPQEFRRTRHV